MKAEKKASVDQITGLLAKIDQIEASHKKETDQIRTKSVTELKLHQVCTTYS